MTPEDLKHGKELEERATQGVWEELYDGNDPDGGLCDVLSDHDDEVISMASRIKDAELIVWLRNHAKELLEMGEENGRLKDEVEDLNVRMGELKDLIPNE